MVDSTYNELLAKLNTRRMAVFSAQTEHATTRTSSERTQSVPVKEEDEASGGEATSCPSVITQALSCHVPATPKSATLPGTSVSRGQLLSSIPDKTSTTPSVTRAVAVDLTASLNSQPQDAAVTMLSEPKIKKELQDLLLEMYVKYPGAQDDDQVEKMALLLKASLLACEEDRVKELKRELKVYLIAHHG